MLHLDNQRAKGGGFTGPVPTSIFNMNRPAGTCRPQFISRNWHCCAIAGNCSQSRLPDRSRTGSLETLRINDNYFSGSMCALTHPNVRTPPQRLSVVLARRFACQAERSRIASPGSFLGVVSDRHSGPTGISACVCPKQREHTQCCSFLRVTAAVRRCCRCRCCHAAGARATDTFRPGSGHEFDCALHQLTLLQHRRLQVRQ